MSHLKMPSVWTPPRASTYWESCTCTQGSFLSGKSSLCRSMISSRALPNRDGVTMAFRPWSISSKVGFLRPYRWNKNCTYFVIFAIWQKELIKCSDIIYIHNEQYNLSISYYVWGWEDLKHILKKPFKAAFIRAKYNENSNTKKYCYTFKITVF